MRRVADHPRPHPACLPRLPAPLRRRLAPRIIEGITSLSLRLADTWVWDFWLARHGDKHHIFYLQAPSALGDPDLRHHNASVGHAISADLRSWTVLPDALGPGPRGAWDDLATWTGSVIEHDERWYMLYTGISQAEAGLIQRIGLAVSDDLMTWRKHPANPVIEADERWYELLDLTSWRDQSWRDPCLFRSPRDNAFHALITARSATGDADGRGVVAHARSADLVRWEVLPPVTTPGDFAQVEVPQLVQLAGHRHILFSAHPEDHSRQRVSRLGPGQEGTYTFTTGASGERFRPSAAPIAPESGPLGPLYAGKLVEAAPGDWRFLAFRAGTDSAFIGEITDPLPVCQSPDGQLSITAGLGGAVSGEAPDG